MDICVSEKKLEDYLFNHLNGTNEICSISSEIASVIDGCVHRQVSLNSYGVADIISVTGHFGCDPEITIYELKKDEITPSALVQVMKYFAAFKKFYDWFGEDFQEHELRCVLIGNSISKLCDFNVAVSVIPFLDIYTYDICPNRGLVLKRQLWEMAETHPPDVAARILASFDYYKHDLDAILYNFERKSQ